MSDFKTFSDRVNSMDIRQLYPFEKSKGNGMYCCPVCGSGTGDHKTGALKISDTGQRITCFANGCFSPQGQDVLGALQILWNVEHWGVFKRLGLYGNSQGVSIPEPVKAPESPRAGSVPEASYMGYIRESMKRIGETDYPQRRGLSAETVKRFMLGYDPAWQVPGSKGSWRTPRLIIPTSEYSYLARYTGAEPIESDKMKAGRPRPFNWKTILKGSGQSTRGVKVVYIVEGEIDAMSVIEAGTEAVGLGSLTLVSRLGEQIEEHRGELHPHLHFIIALDNDPETKKAERAAAAAQELEILLDGYGVSHSRGNPHRGYKDPNQALCEDRQGFVAAVETETAEIKNLFFTSRSPGRKYSDMYRAVMCFHERNCRPDGLWNDIMDDMTATAAAFDNDPFVMELLTVVFQELERESAAAGQASPVE